MGRKKKLSEQVGDLTDKVKIQKKLEEESTFVGNEQLEIIPKWLINDKAINEWNRLVKEFSKKSMISNLDYNNLGAYCNSFAKYINIVEELGIDLFVGSEINPLISLELKYSEEMRKYANCLGLNIESRLKLGSILVGKDGQKVESSFGEI
ncbi:MAG: P27 family phage terminase small subunit [Fusobacteriaceae bacterium]